MSSPRRPISISLSDEDIAYYSTLCECLDCSFSSLTRRALKYFTALIGEEVESGVPLRPGESKVYTILME